MKWYICVCECVCRCVLVGKWISSVISQFKKSPTTAQVSSLTCRLKEQTQMIGNGFFSKKKSRLFLIFYVPQHQHVCNFLSLRSVWRWLPVQRGCQDQVMQSCSVENSLHQGGQVGYLSSGTNIHKNLQSMSDLSSALSERCMVSHLMWFFKC